MMDMITKLKMAMTAVDVTQTELAKRTNQTKQNLSRKMRSNTLNFIEYEKLVNALGCTLEVNIVLPNGKTLQQKESKRQSSRAVQREPTVFLLRFYSSKKGGGRKCEHSNI